MTLRVIYICEGSSDLGLVPHIEQIAAQCDVEISVSAPDLSWLSAQPVGHSVADKLRATRKLSDKYNLAVLHRDADRDGVEARRSEIGSAVESEWPGLAHIPVIPVTMLEAWLLLDEDAIRQVAGNPRGKMNLSLPKAANVERIADPKQRLKETLAKASGLTGRRLADFQKVQRFSKNRQRLMELLSHDGNVKNVPSWKGFVSELQQGLKAAAS
ncbi:DUF4276 family protein [Streptomyces sp. TRM75563]|uniref:DUF4276 family protein n=1 Tax=Streptomyces sp. TRM75563 TaxID=2817418 RepID=UPI001F611F2D|nr:DUF4276 family protein [Streptomyces sp. TRM75563]MCI4041651.1 DUF4276 family protein [Streptomyces sp. TRM75563]